ncbi:tetratricopeptide repeat protein [Beggiatoa alba B18LD]|uniref:Tetratricopeptide repeat protein n=1 Tax=Beggiatoa alba B18LD TaxID=395493 RepID=I3CGV1_9GAMM|nr:tetratricopeptide repeat protein [Beggiatoa alba]EIJ42844.1 tetratricopeptide repeat protein [Beggiatoa alba B18LD]
MFSRFGPSKKSAQRALQKGLQNGDLQPALQIYTRLVEKNPNDCENLHDLGYVLLEMGRTEEAIGYFMQANRIKEHTLHWNQLGRAYQCLQNYSEALAAYKKAMQLDQKDPRPWYNTTLCLREMGQEERAIEELIKLLLTHPSHAGANNELAIHYQKQGKIDLALRLFRTALKTNPNYFPSHLNLIRLLCEIGQFSEARPHLEYIAKYGAYVNVVAQDGKLQIFVDGGLFFSGQYEE